MHTGEWACKYMKFTSNERNKNMKNYETHIESISKRSNG